MVHLYMYHVHFHTSDQRESLVHMHKSCILDFSATTEHKPVYVTVVTLA